MSDYPKITMSKEALVNMLHDRNLRIDDLLERVAVLEEDIVEALDWNWLEPDEFWPEEMRKLFKKYEKLYTKSNQRWN